MTDPRTVYCVRDMDDSKDFGIVILELETDTDSQDASLYDSIKCNCRYLT